jgi:Ser/Thr protein kinase RdoA (MazF antagonist)
MQDTQVLQPRTSSLAGAALLAGRWFAPGEFTVAPLTAEGFSGSPLYRVDSDAGPHVLKAFAAGTPAPRAHFVHAVMRHLRGSGVAEVPVLRVLPDGSSLASDELGQIWELQGLITGESVTRPGAAQARSALVLLARVHLAAAKLPENPPDVGPSPGIARRIEQARGMLARPWAGLGQEQAESCDPDLGTAVRPRLARACAALDQNDAADIVAAVAALDPGPLRRQTVLRDVWAPHVLFADRSSHRTVGLVDYHAAGLDTPATDLARLLGSWGVESGFELQGDWEAALGAYEALRPLRDSERQLVPFLAASGVVFGLDNWFRWIFEQRRRFPEPVAVAARIDQLTAALPSALAMLRRTLPGNPV